MGACLGIFAGPSARCSFLVTPVVSSLEHLFVAVRGPRAVGCPQCPRECLLSGWWALTGFSCADDSSRFLHMFVPYHLFHDKSSQGLICFIYKGGFGLSPYCLLLQGGC